MKHMVPVIAVATVLTLGNWVPLSAEEEKEVQKAAEAEAKGGKIVRWEKEGSNFEAVVEKGGKQTGVEITPDGKVVSRHNESKEHKEKGDKDE